jgi:hypothetical protein
MKKLKLSDENVVTRSTSTKKKFFNTKIGTSDLGSVGLAIAAGLFASACAFGEPATDSVGNGDNCTDTDSGSFQDPAGNGDNCTDSD